MNHHKKTRLRQKTTNDKYEGDRIKMKISFELNLNEVLNLVFVFDKLFIMKKKDKIP